MNRDDAEYGEINMHRSLLKQVSKDFTRNKVSRTDGEFQ
ncbi:hypothetical protein CRE_26191 [Caenorhabditis remanei]|uniref:Uncharacterized protein n=2 Tax=Caenorhabditis remanei TaxID=31234 RepID=E3LQN9_CAERE|nr:hypothetical protein CRE_26191 [Caenorhabditis remanei]